MRTLPGILPGRCLAGLQIVYALIIIYSEDGLKIRFMS